MKIESIIHISAILEHRMNQLNLHKESVFVSDNWEESLEKINQEIEKIKKILLELKHETEMITKFGQNWVQYNPDLLNKKINDKTR